MDYVRPFAMQKVAQSMADLPVPYRVSSQSQGVHAVHKVVVYSVAHYLVAMGLQKVSFSGEYLVFASGLLVVIVNEDDLQAQAIALRSPGALMGRLV
jgi:hypothetical protein